MYNFVEILDTILRVLRLLRLEVSLYNVYITNHFKPHLLKGGGGGVKSVSRGDCEWQGGKLLKLLSQLSPRIQPLFTIEEDEK